MAHISYIYNNTVKPVLSGHLKKTKMVSKTGYCLMQVKSIAECSKGSILQYFRPSLSYHLPLRPLFCLFLSGGLRQVLPYIGVIKLSINSETKAYSLTLHYFFRFSSYFTWQRQYRLQISQTELELNTTDCPKIWMLQLWQEKFPNNIRGKIHVQAYSNSLGFSYLYSQL